MVRFNLDLAYLNLIFSFIHLFIIPHFLLFSLTGLSRILGGRAGARWVSSSVSFQSLTIQIINTLISFSCKTFLFCEEPVYIHEIAICWEKYCTQSFFFMNGGVHPQSTLNHKKLEKKYHWSTYSGRVHPHENGREQLRTCQTPCLPSAWHLHVEMIHRKEIRNDKFTKCTRKFKRENFPLWPLPFQFKDLLFAGVIGLVNLVRL